MVEGRKGRRVDKKKERRIKEATKNGFKVT